MTTTRQLAKLLGIAEQTVRNWSQDYGDLLSPEARGARGNRRFGDEDVQTMRSIVELRRADVPPAEIIERLRRGDIYIDATKPHQATQTAQEGVETPQQATLVQSSMVAHYNTLQHDYAALQRRYETHLRRQLWTHGVAFYLGVLTMGIIFCVVWWLVNGV